nr:hypothetical protein [Tanacetum cinerariifolium]
MDRDYEDSAWSFYDAGWISCISTFKDLNPMIIHFEQIELKTFSVNFYTKDGDEVDYVFTKDHEIKCVVVGRHDPQMYQRVRIAFNGVEVELKVSFSVCSKQKTRVGIAFTGFERERLCNTTKFSVAKAVLISYDKSGGLFLGKVINDVVADTETNLDSATGPEIATYRLKNRTVLPSLVWPKLLTADTNYVELVDARAIVYMVKMDKDYEDSAWRFYGSGWVSFISTFKDLNPKRIHFEQIDLKTFLVNFYTKDGDEVDYVFTKDHEMKCVVVGCHDPRMYQPIPHKMLLNSKVNYDRKRFEWERLCNTTKFSTAKAILISYDESGGSFVGKVINGVVTDTETNLDSAT